VLEEEQEEEEEEEEVVVVVVEQKLEEVGLEQLLSVQTFHYWHGQYLAL
jgi:hypothetical protein